MSTLVRSIYLLPVPMILLFLLLWIPVDDAVPVDGHSSEAGYEYGTDASIADRTLDEQGSLWSQFADIQDGSRILPHHLIPYHYNLHQEPYIYGNESNFTFRGQVEIYIACTERTNRIYFYLGDLDIDNTSASLVFASDRTKAADIIYIERNITLQLICFIASDALRPNISYSFKINFSGPLWSPSEYKRRFYWSSYSFNGTEHYVASTHLSPVDARHAYPCFDEPRFKATFNISIARKPHMTALSNMHLEYTELRDDGFVVDHFHTTPPMPSYLVAFMVCDLPHIETTTASGVKIRIWVPQIYGNASYMLPYVEQILKYLEDVTEIPYPLEKLDIVGVPSMDVSAMENWGLITFTVSRLVVDVQTTKPNLFLDGFATMVHELTHMWFGNLVTPDSWSQVWLKEGFASYFQHRVMDALYPTWDAQDIHLFDDITILDFDTWDSAPPIMKLIQDPAGQRRIFTLQAYYKGAAMVHMMERCLSRDKFDNAIRNFLKRNQYKNANIDVLWDAFNQELNSGRDDDLLSAKELFEPWLTQPGYPSISIDLLNNGSIRIQQSPMKPKVGLTSRLASNASVEDELLSPTSQTGNMTLASSNQLGSQNRTWSVPIFIQQSLGDTRVYWAHDKVTVCDLGVHSLDDLLTRLSYQGFYRINFTEPVWNHLRQMLLKNHLVFSAISRAHFLSDAAAYVRAGERSFVDWYRFAEYLWKERDPLVWDVFFLEKYSIGANALSTEESFQRFMRRMLSGVYQDMGFKVFGMDQFTHRLTQSKLLSSACLYDVNGCQQTAHTHYITWLRQPEKRRTIPPEWFDVIVKYGMKFADEQLWEDTRIYVEMDCTDETEKRKLIKALGQTDDFYERYLQYVLASHTDIIDEVLYGNNFTEYKQRILWTNLLNNTGNATTMTIMTRESILEVLLRVAKKEEDIADIESFIIHSPTNESGLNESEWEERLVIRRQELHDMEALADANSENYNSTLTWMREVVEASVIPSQFTSSCYSISPVRTIHYLIMSFVIHHFR